MNIFNGLKEKLNHLKIKTKLFIFMVLPFVVLTFLGIDQINSHYQTYIQSKQGSQFVSMSLALESLMVEVQKERGLTEFYIAAPSLSFKNKVFSQRLSTDQAIHTFKLLNESEKTHIFNRLADKITIEKKFRAVAELIDELYVIRSAIDIKRSKNSFEFYSTLVTNIIDIIESIEVAQKDPVQSRLTGDFINLLWLTERSGQERGALNGILAFEKLDAVKLQHVLNYIAAQDEIIERFLSTSAEAQQKSLQEILAAKEHQEVLKIRKKIKLKIARDAIISQIKTLIGFNGIIHHIKDYDITGEKSYLEQASLKISELNQVAINFENHYLINQEDYTAIDTVKNLAHSFETVILNAESDNHQLISAKNLSQRFNENAVQLALEHLQRGKLDILAAQWWALTTKRLEAIVAINHNIRAQLVGNANKLEHESIQALLLSASVITFTLLFSFLLCYFILQRLVGEIGNIVRFMNQTKHHHHFDQQITLTGNDEITEMEIAYNELLIERKKSEHLNRISAAVFEYASEAILISNAENIIEEVNPAFTKITGYEAEEVIGKTPALFKSGRHGSEFYQSMWNSINNTDIWQGEVWNRRKNGEIFPEYLAISAVRDNSNKVIQHIALFSDISKHKQYEEDIWHQANYDALTQLPNRNLLSNRLEHEVKLMQRQNLQLAVLFIDLDRFKHVNDTYGHSFGDELIVSIATRFKGCIRESDTIARLGGDEFIVLLPNLSQIANVEKVAKALLAEASAPVSLSNGHQAIVSASVGISVYPDDANNAESLLKNADVAMYQAKEQGKNTLCFYTSNMNEGVSKRMLLELELRRAIKNKEFIVHYQPIFNIESETITGVEALVRWQHPDEGLIYPDDFISVAEDTGLIVDIGLQVLEQAAKDLRYLHKHEQNIQVTVNISGRQFDLSAKPIAQEIAKVLHYFDIPAEFFNIEITESALMKNIQHGKDMLREVKDLGVKIFMDDFGTGYSSLSYLRQFPIDVLKIDRSFIWKMMDSDADKNLVKAIITMGQNLQLKLVAEGVETKEHLDYLTTLGCDFIQGYYIAKPIPIKELMALLSSSEQAN